MSTVEKPVPISPEHRAALAAAGNKVVQCATCGADMVFMQTAANKRMPVNAETVEPGDVLFEHGRHVSHFGTCPQAAAHRRRPK